MGNGADDFDPEDEEERAIGREMVDKSTGLGSVAAHLYRGEMERAVNWRGRLDTTTNWAVTMIGGILAYAFSGGGDISHTILLVAMLVGWVFLLIEARRFREYDIWRSRVRILQENLFANALDPSDGVEHRDWREQLSEDYRDPERKMSYHDAISHRLRRVYLPLLFGLLAIWIFRLMAYSADDSWIAEAAVQGVPGTVVVGAVSLTYAVLIGIVLWPSSGKTGGEASEVDHGDLDRTE